jgi:LPXTG-site transpeptidase (sortase) family protein
VPSREAPLRPDPRRRSQERAGGGRRRVGIVGLIAALAGGVLLSVAAARWLEGVFAQELARSARPAKSDTASSRQAAVVSDPALPPLPLRSLPPPAEAPAPAPAAGDVVGRIRIPRVGIDFAVFEGVTAEILRKGPGHVPGTALPTEGSNCVITAHRDSFFRRLAHVRAGDTVLLSGEGGEREYRLASRRVVDPTEVSVLEPSVQEQVTLVTCYPFRWIGPAPYRVVWQALPVASNAKRDATGGPAAVGSP